MLVYNQIVYYNREELINLLSINTKDTKTNILQLRIKKYILLNKRKHYSIPDGVGVCTYFKSLLNKELEHDYIKVFDKRQIYQQM